MKKKYGKGRRNTVISVILFSLFMTVCLTTGRMMTAGQMTGQLTSGQSRQTRAVGQTAQTEQTGQSDCLYSLCSQTVYAAEADPDTPDTDPEPSGGGTDPELSGESTDPESSGENTEIMPAENSGDPLSSGGTTDKEDTSDTNNMTNTTDTGDTVITTDPADVSDGTNTADPEETVTIPVEISPQGESGGDSGGSVDVELIEPAAGESFGILRAPLPGAAGDGEILAERVDTSSIQAGDRIVIVCDAVSSAVSTTASTDNRVSPAEVTVAETPKRQVLTAISPDAAVFEVESAGEDRIYLKCDKGYLTSLPEGNGLYYAGIPEDCSAWQFRDGEFLYNPAVASPGSNGTIWRNYYLEYYGAYNYFSTYAKGKNSSPDAFRMAFYRMGNSDPEDVITHESYYTLPVFHTSDTHGYLADTSGNDTLYLLAYISDKVKDVRGYGDAARKDKAVLVDGGDIYQGNTMSNLLQGQSLAAAYKIMGYDAVTIGNHEFDWGIETTVDSDGTMMDSHLEGHNVVNDIPVIISNLYRSGVKVSFADDYIILEKTATDENGNELPVKIGVIGFAEDYSSSVMYSRFTGEDYSINPDFAIANNLASYLEGNGLCDATILLTHQEAGQGAGGLGDNTVIDLVLGGHTHQSVNGTTDGDLRYMEPSCYGKAYAYSELAFQIEDGRPVFRRVNNARVIPTNSNNAKLTNDPANADELDPELVKLTDDVMDILSDLYKQEIGYITESAYRYVYLPDSGDRSTTYGNWAASIYAGIVDADVAFVNGGGLRTDMRLDEGADRRTIYRSDIHTMFPFDNHMQCYELTWGELLEAFDYSLTDQGKTLLSQVVGVDCYFTDRTVNALVTPDGKTIYANGEWAEGWKDKKIRVAVSEFIGTNDRVDETTSLHNPFIAWSSTSRLVSDDKIDSEGAYEVLTAEAAANNGLLTIDTKAHYINKEFTGSVYVPDSSEDPGDNNQTGTDTEDPGDNNQTSDGGTGNDGNDTANNTTNNTTNNTANSTGNNTANNTANSTEKNTGNNTANNTGNNTGNSTSGSGNSTTGANRTSSTGNRTSNSSASRSTNTNRTATGNQSSRAPGTGDENRPLLWAAAASLSGLSLLILAAVIVRNRRKDKSDM